ncbi:MAG: bifunctional metallophosphatase/5'-nucleotidase [Deltaproteobacteria bacterium]|nr:bifunctional metallophosphatase/5'-nucleotidase [Deltaproteobacteria bacterium]
MRNDFAARTALTVLISALAPVFCAPSAGAQDLVIYHTNDVHGYAFEELDGEGNVVRIGYDRLKALVDSDPAPAKLLLDAGDVLHGQAFATVRQGGLMAEVLSLAGYDALAAGNHDFDYGYGRLLELSGGYRLRFLAANVLGGDGTAILAPYLVRSWSGLKVGIFGLSTPMTRTSTDPRNVQGLEFADPIETARAAVDLLKAEGVDLIVALMHMGSEPYCEPTSQAIAERVPGIDIAIDGHSHSVTVIQITREDGSRAVVASAGAFFENVGRIAVDRDADGGFSVSASIIPASSPEIQRIRPDQAMREALNALKSDLDDELGGILMTVPFDLDGSRQNMRSSSTNLGRLVCAAMAAASGADIALLNGGSVHDSIAKGEVTRGQLLSVFPYGDSVYRISVTGEVLLASLVRGFGQPGAGGFPQFWGMEIEAERRLTTASDGTEEEILAPKSVTVGGKPLDPKATYVLAVNDFMYSGGDDYSMFANIPFEDFGPLMEIFRDYMTMMDHDALKAVADAVVLR